MSLPRLFLIDAHALCYRSYFAIKELSTSYGQATNAVYGFLSTLRKILRDYQPDYMAVCFDVGKKTLRQEKYTEYKIHRPAMPDNLISQIPLIKEVVAAYRLPQFELEGFEADDVIATITEKVSRENLEVVIVSGDKDMMQLVDAEKVKIFNVRKDEIIPYSQLQETFGIDPKRMADYLGLVGDQSDNIPGVIGIGEVTARELINQFGTLENILANINDIKSDKVREKIQNQKEQALFSKELATLDRKVPIAFELETLKVSAPDSSQLFELFKKLEFRKLAEEFAPQGSTEKGNSKPVHVRTLTASNDIKELAAKLQKKGTCIFLCDREQGSEDVLFSGFMFSVSLDEMLFIAEDNIGQLKPVFEDTKIIKVCHNSKECMKVLFKKDIVMKGRIFDVMLAAYLLAPSQGAFDVETLAWIYLKMPSSANDNLAKKVELLAQMYPILEKELNEKELIKLFNEIEIPLAYVLFRMETEGVTIDQELLKELSSETEKKIEELITQLYQLAGSEFNLNSPKQLSEVLFAKLKLPVVKKTKTGFSTDEGVLLKLAEKHPLPKLILDYRQLAKLKSTYIDALPRLVNHKTNRLHAFFNQTGTETGRLSSNNPNLQNIPIRTELGRQIRKAFIASREDKVIISADYSQIELRILAHLSQDKNLIKAFQEGQDIHAFTAALIFDIKEAAVTSQMRNSAKRVNFGIIYGISAFGLSKDLGVSQQEAQDFIDKYFLRYPDVKKFMDEEIKKAEKNGFVLTLLNRRRYLPEIYNINATIKQFAQRQAINTPVQGSAADLLKLAMINIQKELEAKSFESKMIITVHDELVFDVLEKERVSVVEIIREQMEHPLKLSVPIKASVKVGRNWLDMQEI